MTKYVILYLAPVSAEQQMNVSPEEMKKGMEPWLVWYNKAGKAIVDPGSPLGKGVNVDKKGGSKGKTQVAGYTIVEAENIDAVKSLLADHPHLMMPDASIEILEVMPMSM